MTKLLTPTEVVQALMDGKEVERLTLDGDKWYKVMHLEILSVSTLIDPDYKYRLAQEMITVGDVSFPKPESKPLKNDDEYWVADPTFIDYATSGQWAGDKLDKCALSRGLLHRSKENAIAHAKALIKLSGGECEQ